MPAAFAAPAIGYTLGAIGATTGAVASVYGANKQAASAKDAARATERSTAEAIALERENEARRREEWDKTQAFNEQVYREEVARDEARYADTRGDAAFNRDRATKLDAFDREKYDRYETRRQPYRDVSRAALLDYAAKAGLTIKPSSMASAGK